MEQVVERGRLPHCVCGVGIKKGLKSVCSEGPEQDPGGAKDCGGAGEGVHPKRTSTSAALLKINLLHTAFLGSSFEQHRCVLAGVRQSAKLLGYRCPPPYHSPTLNCCLPPFFFWSGLKGQGMNCKRLHELRLIGKSLLS